MVLNLKRLWIIALALYSFTAIPARADDLLVLYPDIREPYRQIFNNIVDGIRNRHDGEVTAISIAKDDSTDLIEDQLNNKEMGIIALGTRSLNMVSALENKPVTIVGALVTDPQKATFPSLTLIPDPNTIFEKVAALLPSTKRIYVVHSSKSSPWIIDIAHQAAKSRKLELISHEASSVKELAVSYRDIMKKMNPKEDILWVSSNGASLEWAILKNILEKAWRSNLQVVSSNVSDVKKGVLFSFLPNHQPMGEELVDLYKRYQSKPSTRVEVFPVKSLGVAVNLRTADHLNLEFDKEDRKSFSLTYPPNKR